MGLVLSVNKQFLMLFEFILSKIFRHEIVFQQFFKTSDLLNSCSKL